MTDERSHQPAPQPVQQSAQQSAQQPGRVRTGHPSGAATERTTRVTFLGGTSHSRSTVDVAGRERDVADRESADGSEPPPAGCPCTSGF